MELILTNKNGQTLDLLNNTNYFILSACEALHGVETDIATVDMPFQDGVQVEKVKTLPRGIVLTFKLVPDIKNSIEFFTQVVKSKQYVTLTETENGQSITIKGIATIPPYTRMLSACSIQLEIYCPQPYWEDLTQVIGAISQYINLLYFPVNGQYFTITGRPFGSINLNMEKTFDNNGDVATGMQIIITALGEVVNPRISCSTGEQNGNYMQLNLTLQQNDEVIINTIIGNKSILINNSNTYQGQPVLSFLTFTGNNWLQLETGSNTFNVTATSGAENLYFTIVYKRRYE